MVIHLILGILCVSIAAIAGLIRREGLRRMVLMVPFILIFIFLALRFDFGNDYMSYYDIFYDVGSLRISDVLIYDGRVEIGWLFLCLIFKSFGFYSMVAFLAALNSIVYYRFLIKYCPHKYYWLFLFLYIFTPDLMLIQASAMRQSLAILIFILSLEFLFSKNIFMYLLLVALGYFFHSSIVIVMPLCILPFFMAKESNVIPLFAVLLYFYLYLSVEKATLIVNYFVINYFDKYEVYDDVSVSASGLGVFLTTILFFTMAYVASYIKGKDKVLLEIGIFGYMFSPLGLVVSMVVRLGFYYKVMLLVAVPLMVENIKNKKIKYTMVLLFMFFTLYQYFYFFQSPVWKVGFSTYKTIFCSETICLL